MKIGVLALQGAVAEHIRLIEQCGEEAIAIKTIDQLKEIDGLIIPGGESTTIGHLIRKYGFDSAIQEFSSHHKPIFGTCAGLIVLAKEISNQDQSHLQLMDIQVTRNAFGRQKESFEANLKVEGISHDVRAVFIRAPLIDKVGSDVEILSYYQDQIVAAKQGNLLVTSFHPELTDDHRIHQYFINMIKESKKSSILS